MILKKDILKMREKLVKLEDDLKILKEYYRPKKKLFGIFSSGDLFIFGRYVSDIERVNVEIKLIDWILKEDNSFFDFISTYNVDRECADDILRMIDTGEMK